MGSIHARDSVLTKSFKVRIEDKPFYNQWIVRNLADAKSKLLSALTVMEYTINYEPQAYVKDLYSTAEDLQPIYDSMVGNVDLLNKKDEDYAKRIRKQFAEITSRMESVIGSLKLATEDWNDEGQYLEDDTMRSETIDFVKKTVGMINTLTRKVN